MEEAVLSVDKDGIGHLWDVKTRAVMCSYRECDSRSLAFISDKASPLSAPDGFLTACTIKSSINMFSVVKDVPVFKCAAPEAMVSITATPNSTFVIAGGLSGKLYAWDLLSGELLRSWNGHYKSVTTLAVSSCGTLLVSGGSDGIVHVWSIPQCIDYVTLSNLAIDPKPVASWTEHSLPITAVLFGPHAGAAARVFSASADRSVKVWNITSSASVLTVHLPSPITCMAVAPHETCLVVGREDGVLSRIDLHLSILRTVAAEKIAFSRPQRLADVDVDGAVSLEAELKAAGVSVDPSAGHVFLGHAGAVSSVSVTRDASTVVSSGADGTVRIWDIISRQQLAVFESHKAPVLACRLMVKPHHFALPTRHAAPLHIAPLKKHAAIIHADWKDALTGPPTDMHVVKLEPTTYSTDYAARLNEQFQSAIDFMLNSISAAKHVQSHVSAQQPDAPPATTDNSSRITELEAENARWKAVNTALLQKLQEAGLMPAPAEVSGSKRPREEN